MNFDLYGVVIVPLLIAFGEFCKMVGLPKKFVPITNVVLGLVVGILGFSNGNYFQGTIIGLALGLSSLGLYSGTKSVVKK